MSFDWRSCRLSFVGVLGTDGEAGDIALGISFDLTSYWSSFVGVFSISGEAGNIVIEVSLDVGTEGMSPSGGRSWTLVIGLAIL